MGSHDEQKALWMAEQNAARSERTNKRSFILNVILILALVFSYCGFFVYESQFTDEVQVIEAEQQADGNGNNYIVGGNYGGETESNNNN